MHILKFLLFFRLQKQPKVFINILNDLNETIAYLEQVFNEVYGIRQIKAIGISSRGTQPQAQRSLHDPLIEIKTFFDEFPVFLEQFLSALAKSYLRGI